MDYCCEQCGFSDFDVEYNDCLTCKNCFHVITWTTAIEEIFNIKNLKIIKDKQDTYEIRSKDELLTKLAKIKFAIGKDINTIILESYSYEHIAQIINLLTPFRGIFRDLRIFLAKPSKEAGTCPVCKSSLNHELMCNKKGHYYNLSSTILLISIVLKQSVDLQNKVEVYELESNTVRVIVDGDSFHMEFRQHGEEKLLAVSKKAFVYFRNILAEIKIFAKTTTGKVQRIVTVDI